jgi:LPXTG-site transpeptidase (sortase) family protein
VSRGRPNLRLNDLRRRLTPGTLLLGVGAVGVLVGGAVLLDTVYEASRFQGSPEQAQAERSLEAPQPIWIEPAATAPTAVTISRAVVQATPAPRPTPAPSRDLHAADRSDTHVPLPTDTPVPEPTEVPIALELTNADFRFLDPPEPGAHARLTASVHSISTEPSAQFNLAIPMKWLSSGYHLEKITPNPADGTPPTGQAVDDDLRISFEGLAPDAAEDITVDVVATAEVLDAPDVRILDADGREVGHLKPPTQAPHPRPGPVWSISLPRLNIRSGVVPVDWEPPLFVVGQLKDSAYVTQGNSVLVGHLVGSLGNVFQHLDRVNIGDEVIATSRGEQYRFVVSQKEVLPPDDTTPVEDSDTPRLTLMTCTGVWNPLTRDYSERLWVIAEPADLAAQTIASGAAAPRNTPTPVPPTPTPAPPRPVVQIAGPGGLGNTDADLAKAFGAPVGEASGGLVVYHANSVEYRAAFTDTTDPPARRAAMIGRVPARPMSLDDARKEAQALLPKDAVRRGSAPEGNSKFVVERYTSPSLADAIPPQGYAEGESDPGDFLVVYTRMPDGRITDIVVGLGNDAEGLLRPFSR